jgi:hypothetical protein
MHAMNWSRFGLVGAMAAAIAGPALAADEAPSVSLHGFADLVAKTDYITPRGLRVHSDGSAIQFLNGLVLVFPDNLSVVAGTWTDFNPGYAKPNTQAINEFDWFIGVNKKIAKNLTAGAQYVEFISAPGAFKTERNIEFSLAYDDSGSGKPIAIKPYAKFFWAMSGDSTVVVGKRGDTFDVEIGATPTMSLQPYGMPLVLTAPTWITVGPESYWGGGGNAGVFSTGLKATLPLKVPASAGSWSVYAGYQYYHLINDRLVLAQSILNPGKTDRNIHLFQVGVGLGF